MLTRRVVPPHVPQAVRRVKMFMKRKIRVGKAYAYRMLAIFKASVSYKESFNFVSDNCVVRFEVAFVGHCLIFLPDILQCLALKFWSEVCGYRGANLNRFKKKRLFT